MAKKTTTFCTMCGAPNSKENPVVNIYEGLYMCTECIAFIDGKRDEALNKIKADFEYVKELELPFSVAGAIKFKHQAQFNPLKFIKERFGNATENNFRKKIQ